jgi:hypothetical protein
VRHIRLLKKTHMLRCADRFRRSCAATTITSTSEPKPPRSAWREILNYHIRTLKEPFQDWRRFQLFNR